MPGVVRFSALLRILLCGQRLLSEWPLRKDGGTVGADQGCEDLRGHGGAHVYRGRATAEIIGWLRHWAGMNWALYVEGAWSGIDAVCVREGRFAEAPTARATGIAVDVGDQDF